MNPPKIGKKSDNYWGGVLKDLLALGSDVESRGYR
jgi:hypothetical protein